MSDNVNLWRYYEGTTSANTVIRDLSKVLSTAVKTTPLYDSEGNVIKPKEVIQERNWDIVHPAPDWKKLNVRDRNNLTPDEFEEKIADQASRITDVAILKTKTTPKALGELEEDDIGLNQDIAADSLEMYVELYKPKYLSDPEQHHPEVERRGIVPYLVTEDIYREFAATTGQTTLNLLDDIKTEDGEYPKGLTVETLNDPYSGRKRFTSDTEFKRIMSVISDTFNVTFDANKKISLTEDQIALCKFNTELENFLLDLLGLTSNTFYKLSVLTFESKVEVLENTTERILLVDALRYANVYTLDNTFEYKLEEPGVMEDTVSLTIGGLAYRDAWSYSGATKILTITKTITGEAEQIGEPLLTYSYSKEENFIKTRKLIHNNHYIYVRMFDTLNEEGDGPIAGTVDDKTGEILAINSKVSEWSKLSWYQDFQERYIDELDSDHGSSNISEGIVFLPVESPGLNAETRMSFWANVNNNRVNLVIMGNPSLDFSSNKHLISAAYIGQIESFEDSVNDTSGNFALFTSSSTDPCYSDLVERKVSGIESQLIGLGNSNSDNIFTASLENAKMFKQTGSNYSIKLEEPNGDNIILQRFTGFNVSFNNDKTVATIEVFVPPTDGTKVTLTYDYDIIKYRTENGTVRDSLGNKIKVHYPDSYGKNTATGVIDVSMLSTRSRAYFQKHHMMFTTTEEFMTKEMYGKSVYTGEYYADRIKLTHGNDGPRGMLAGCLAIGTSSLHAFDELIVNRDFIKDEKKPEETYIFFPITAPYSPFAGSPNANYGFAIKKSVRDYLPKTDAEAIELAKEELDLLVGNLSGITEDIYLPITAKNGVTVRWTSSVTESITFAELTEEEVNQLGKVTRPLYGNGDSIVSLTATLTKGEETGEKIFLAVVKEAGMSDAQATLADSEWLDIPNKGAIKSNIALPLEGPNETVITWVSEKTDIVSDEGYVVRPANGEAAVTVDLEALITKGSAVETKTIQVKVLPWTDQEEVDQAFSLLNFEAIRGSNTKETEIMYNLNLKKTGDKGTTITWKSTNDNVINVLTGRFSAPLYTTGNVQFALQASITKNKVTKIKTFVLTAIRSAITNAEAVSRAANLVDESSVQGANTSVNAFTQSVNLFTQIDEVKAPECKSVTISWKVVDPETKESFIEEFKYATIHVDVTGVELEIVRPTFTEGNKEFELEATIVSSNAVGDRTEQKKSIKITIIAEEPTPEEAEE